MYWIIVYVKHNNKNKGQRLKNLFLISLFEVSFDFSSRDINSLFVFFLSHNLSINMQITNSTQTGSPFPVNCTCVQVHEQ